MRVLVLTSGGDAPGMNMVLATLFVRYKSNLYAARAGFRGLINNDITKIVDFHPLHYSREAGTCIKSSRCKAFETEEGFKKGLENAKRFDVLVVLGGNGTFNACKKLAEEGIKVVYIPSTIDNDVIGCDYCLGYHTAVMSCVNTINNIMPSMDSFDRCCIFEIMGRYCPRIINCVNYKRPCDYMIINKKDVNYEKIANIIKNKHDLGQGSAILLKEKVIKAGTLTKNLNKIEPDIEIKNVNVGYVQRGSKPTDVEMDYARGFAKQAIEAINKHKNSVAIMYTNNQFKFCDL